MTNSILEKPRIFKVDCGAFGANRYTASIIRHDIEKLIYGGVDIVDIIIDFSGMENSTQGFIDELLGRLFATGDIGRVQFYGCSENIKEIIRFVASDRQKSLNQVND